MLGPYVERRLEELAGAKLVAGLHRSEDAGRPARSEQAVRQLLGDTVTLRHRPDGKPEIDGGQSVSLAHTGELTLAVAARGPLGCDLETVTERSIGAWRGMLGTERFALAEVLARELSEDFNASATRVWTAMEGLKKAGAPANTPLLLTKASPDGWLMLSAGEMAVASFVASVREVSKPVALAIVTRATPG